MNRLIGVLSLASCAVLAQAQEVASTAFPEGSAPLATEALRKALSGKVFTSKSSDGTSIRFEFQDSGHAFLDASTGFRDNGKWSVVDSKLCAEWKKAVSGCTEARVSDGVVYFKRLTNGEVTSLVPR